MLSNDQIQWAGRGTRGGGRGVGWGATGFTAGKTPADTPGFTPGPPLPPDVACYGIPANMLLNAPTTEVDIKDPVGATLHQLNKRLARLHYLLMYIGARDKNSRKLLEEIASCRRNCIELCWNIKENILSKVNRISLLGKSEIYLRALTDCLEMYIKEISILQHIQATVQIASFATVSSKKATKAKKTAKVATENHNTDKLEDDLSLTILAEEKAEVTELYQLILNRLAAGDSSGTGDEAEGTSNGNSKSGSRRKRTEQSLKTTRTSRLLCCTCSNDYV